MKKYVTMKCSVCARTRDSLIDITHYATDKCTITLGCEGRLAPIGYTSDGTVLNSIPPTGLTNWYPRGSAVTGIIPLTEQTLYDTATGATKRQFILAVSNTSLGFVPSDNATIALHLAGEPQSAKDYRQYLYRKSGSFTTVNGTEDGASKKVLRYDITGTNPDVVDVYVNGVKYVRGTTAGTYRLYDGTVTSAAPPNTVLFNTTITGSSTQVDVIVTKAAVPTELTLNFSRMILDESRTGTGAWEGIDAVKHQATKVMHSLFYCDVSEVAPLQDVKLRLSSTASTLHDAATVTLNPAWGIILLSHEKLYTPLDRQRAMYVPLSALNNATNYLVMKFIDGVYQLLVTKDSAVDVFPPFEVIRLSTAALVKTGVTGDSSAQQLNNSVIVGPDA